jgi:peroxiredoxin
VSMDVKRESEGLAPRTGIDELRKLPPDLPIPQDDGGAAHLLGTRLPQIELVSSRGTTVDLSALDGWLVLYCFPRMAKAMSEVPQGWSEIPGARGCTVQSLTYNDELAEFDGLGAAVFGVSTESPDEQREAVKRLGLKHVLLSDAEGRLARALNLPVFEAGQGHYLRRLTFCAHNRDIEQVWYPVFPPGQDVIEAKAWLAEKSDHKGRPPGEVVDR